MESLKTPAVRISSRGFSCFEALDGLDADLRVFGIGGVDRDYLRCADGGFADVGVIDDEFFPGLHAAQVEEGLVVGDAVPCGLTVALEVFKGVFAGFGL